MADNRARMRSVELGRIPEPERHQDRVHGCSVTQVLAAPQAFALEAIRLVEGDRRLVPWKDMELELLHSRARSPRDGLVEQCPADASPPMRARHHEPEVGDMPARRMHVSRERESANWPAFLNGNEHRRVRMSTNHTEIPPLVGDAPPLLSCQKPRAVLAADSAPELDESLSIPQLGRPDRDHGTTIP